ncbi:MAG: helix-turn-helix domain-containing protein [Proteobacteria bacterium]|nr:helix-turn-helix domain-containing protein [Pseudomonadota bacterium]
MHTMRFVESYFDAWNHRDPMGVADHLVDDGIYRDVPENFQKTRSELITSLDAFFAEHRYRYELIGEVMTSRKFIAFQYRLSSSDNGFAGSYCGAEFMTLSGDAALQITDYYEVPKLVRSVRVTADRSLKHKYAKSGLNATQLEEIQCRLETIMHSDQVFLRSDLTLPKLAAVVDCSVNHLSQVINSGCGMSFFDYLNQHRIEYAKNQLGACGSNNCAILNVAFAAGFNSNSAFYAAFKKCIGQTPAQYRRAQLRKTH